jgi:hypothetical protein
MAAKRRARRRKPARARAPAESPAAPPSGSLGEWLGYLGANVSEEDWLPIWPPDAFAIGAGFLRRTGGYVGLVNGVDAEARSNQANRPEAIGAVWRESISAALREGVPAGRLRDQCPAQVRMWWRTLRDRSNQLQLDAAPDTAATAAAWNLCIASDAASARIGIAIEDDPFLGLAQALLQQNDLRSFCHEIRPEKLAVLGKQHTPQRGCTIRSLTHHLALYTPTEIKAYWSGPYRSSNEELDVFNLLLLPWPTEVNPSDFTARAKRTLRRGPARPLGSHRYFDFEPKAKVTPAEMARRVTRALDAAGSHADKIHGLVFPELSLDGDQYLAVERVAVARGALLIAGVRSAGDDTPSGMPENFCAVQPLGIADVPRSAKSRHMADWLRLTQSKHHRWCLDRNQVLQYELGGRLPSAVECWERIQIEERRVNFVAIGEWLMMCVLICEDLARQDPVAEVIRSIGPNLVFALLMDGPQLRSRWPSRYASVLAEDPGCSVLSLTNLGMAKRSRPRDLPPGAPDKSRTIALWRDAREGEREIGLEPGHDASVLSLVGRRSREYTIDGRFDDDAYFPVYAGDFSFKVPEV